MRGHLKSRRPAKTSAKRKPAATRQAVLGTPQPEAAAPNIKPEWAWHYRVLQQLRDDLLRERSEQRRNVAEPLEPHSTHLADSATDEFDHDLTLSRLSAEQDALYEVNEAISRIVN